jgi:hypothetical protein
MKAQRCLLLLVMRLFTDALPKVVGTVTYKEVTARLLPSMEAQGCLLLLVMRLFTDALPKVVGTVTYKEVTEVTSIDGSTTVPITFGNASIYRRVAKGSRHRYILRAPSLPSMEAQGCLLLLVMRLFIDALPKVVGTVSTFGRACFSTLSSMEEAQKSRCQFLQK